MAAQKGPKAPPKEFKFKYHFPEDYKPIYTNGVWGGVTPRGEIEIHFLYDRRPLPLHSTHGVTKDGGLSGTPKKVEIGDSMLRFVQAGVVMDLAAAQSLYTWLGEKLKGLEEAARAKH
jgi:hypothetical protein